MFLVKMVMAHVTKTSTSPYSYKKSLFESYIGKSFSFVDLDACFGFRLCYKVKFHSFLRNLEVIY